MYRVIYLVSHQIARVPVLEEMPVAKYRISDHLRRHLVDRIHREAFRIRRSISNVQESELREASWMVIGETTKQERSPNPSAFSALRVQRS